MGGGRTGGEDVPVRYGYILNRRSASSGGGAGGHCRSEGWAHGGLVERVYRWERERERLDRAARPINRRKQKLAA
jgi:hypothetical protein